ncbi:DnaJ domain-containing protein [uncultured Legionella sp.]|uniref:J domain-containing protein n=1 Tax=uncultured Legionella sp. TaxID=210934 RepID=UPI0026381F6B|nr:DnaJ domain-containing protein [uncultured Legionella sp.]
MSLPLDDSTNPLYQQSVVAQVNRIINWQQHFTSAHALFSLTKHYTKKDIVAAYHQLAMRFHPDKNGEIPEAADAFKIINSAKEFLDFELLSPTEQRENFQQVANNPFLTAELQYPFFGTKFNSGFGNPYTQGYGTAHKEDFNNPSLYKDQGFSAILAVLERGRKAMELRKGPQDFCPFKLPSAAKERLATLMTQCSTAESINIVDWLNLCRYQDDFDVFQQLCDYTLSQKHQAPLAQIKDFLPKSDEHSDNTTLVHHLFAVIDARTAHFVMSQLSRFIDTNAQDELLHYFKELQFNAESKKKWPSYHVIAAFLGWHSSSEQLRSEIRADIKGRSRKFNWKNERIPVEEFCFDEDSRGSFNSTRLCSLPGAKRRQHISALISLLREQEVFNVSEALYTASGWECLDEVSQILSNHPTLPINPYYLLYDLIFIDIFNPESDNSEDTLKNLVLPNGVDKTRENVIICITRLFQQILAHAQLSPEQLSELFLFLVENKEYLDAHSAHFILARMDECGLADMLQKKIWQHCIKISTYGGGNPTFFDMLIKRAKSVFFDSIPLHHYLLCNSPKPELVTKILSAEPRFISYRYAEMPVMREFCSYNLFRNPGYHDKYRIGTVNGLYLHHSLTTIEWHLMPRNNEACAIIEAMRAEDYALFNVALEIPIYRNPEHHDVYQWFYDEPLLRHSRCDAMHLAAIRGHDKELLAMLQKGGNYHQKAAVWKTSTFFGIETLILEQKSSYQYAKEQHLPESCRWILQQELKDYIQGRQKEDNYITRLSLCGYTLWNGGYNREDKVYGAKALLRLIESTHFVGFGQDLNAANHFAQEHPALTQGRLGVLFDNYKKLCHWYEKEQKDRVRFSWEQPQVLYADQRGFYDIKYNNRYTPTMN